MTQQNYISVLPWVLCISFPFPYGENFPCSPVFRHFALFHVEGRRGPVVGHSLWTRPARVQSPWEARIIRCKNLALYIRDCESLCLSDETVNAVGPFYLVSMPGEVKDPTQGVNV